jgi:ribose transport system ATP-binding protein
MKAAGVSMIYISHRLGEIEDLCDRVMVLRDGKMAGELNREEINRDSMVRLMVGRDISRFFPEAGESVKKAPVLSVQNLTRPGCPWTYDFSVHAGEILGIAGLVGAGRTELMKCIFGVDRPTSGRILIDGSEVRINCPTDAIRCGIGLVPEDRKGLGLVLEMAVKENISLPGINTYHRVVLKRCREQKVALEQVNGLSVKTPGIEQEVQFLSGGNQQKVSLGKWLALNPKVLILDEPTRGIDVGSKSEIYKLIRNLADSGMAVIMVSSEMEEVLGLADRILVMHEGKITGELDRTEATEEKIMQFATGGSTK